MDIAVVVFVKTPGISPIKSRLAHTIGNDLAEKFFIESTQCLEKTLMSFQDSLLTPNIHLYYSVAEREGLISPFWKSFNKIEQGPGGLGQKISQSYSKLLKSYDGVVLLGGDLPHIDLSEFKRGLELITRGKDVIGPTEDGGFYFFGSSKEIPESEWASIQYSSSDTCNSLIKKLNTLCDFEYLNYSFDIDEYQDILKLKQYKNKNLIPIQEKFLAQLDQFILKHREERSASFSK